MGDLSGNFSRVEFSCRCGCGHDLVYRGLLTLLEDIREDAGRRVVIKSGCRCKDHNVFSGGSTWSQHVGWIWDDDRKLWTEGPTKAADIFIEDTIHRHAVVGSAHYRGATGIGVAKGFVHVDVGVADPAREIVRPAMWTY